VRIGLHAAFICIALFDTMLKWQSLRWALFQRSSKPSRQCLGPSAVPYRSLTFSRAVWSEKKHSSSQPDTATTAASSGKSGQHEGAFARTDSGIAVQYPDQAELARTVPVQGRGGKHFKRTLAGFSLEDRVAVVTGGARGLGLVMAQALVESGASVALVDLNGECSKGNLNLNWIRGSSFLRSVANHTTLGPGRKYT